LNTSKKKKTATPYSVPWSKPDIGKDEKQAVERVLKSGWLSQGKVTEDFEKELAKYSGAKYAVAVNSGSSALLCALLAHHTMHGDRVLVPDYTHVATASVPILLGCKLSPVDICLRTLNVSVPKIEKSVRIFRPRFVISVDVAGMPNDRESLCELANRYEFTLIQDGAEALGAKYKGLKIGSTNNTVILSFHAAKPITTVQGGAVLTNDERIAERCRLIRNFGQASDQSWLQKIVGTNLKTTDLQSAIGIVQLRKLEMYIRRRNRIAERYRDALSEWFSFQKVPEYVTRHPYMMFISLASSQRIRNMLKEYLLRRRIDTRTPFPPLHIQPQLKSISSKRFSNSIYAFRHSLALPIYNTMENHEVEHVISSVSAFFQQVLSRHHHLGK